MVQREIKEKASIIKAIKASQTIKYFQSYKAVFFPKQERWVILRLTSGRQIILINKPKYYISFQVREEKSGN